LSNWSKFAARGTLSKDWNRKQTYGVLSSDPTQEIAMATNTDDIRNSMSKDVAALQQEVSRLQKMISAQGTEAYYELRDRAGRAYDEAAPRARTAVAQIKAGSTAAAQAARDNATATTTALLLAGAIGFLAGYTLGGATQPEPRHWWR
jgi:ElaB/YqjD/DUF883 family membrane-anchored ribosome-binding protein